MTYYQNPYYGYYPMAVQQPMIYPQQQMVEQPQTNLSVQGGQTGNNANMNSYMIWVQGKAGAQSYPVARGTYNGGSSYGRGRSMSMYDGRGSSYARGNGYSRGSNKDEVLDQLQYIMDMTSDEKDRKAISRLMEQMSER